MITHDQIAKFARGLYVAKKALGVKDADDEEKNWREAEEYLKKKDNPNN